MPFTNTPSRSMRDERKLVVLDIDETLLHASTTELDQPLDYRATRTFVYKRPHVDQFLRYCLQNYRVAVWTTASAQFAQEIFSEVFPIARELEFIWSFEHCTDSLKANGDFNQKIKDLSKIESQSIDLKNIVMIDDTAEKLRLNQTNLIHISPFFGEQNDRELLFLIEYLETIKELDDIGEKNKQNWRQHLSCSYTGFDHHSVRVG